MKKVGVVGCTVEEQRFFTRQLPEFDLAFYGLQSDLKQLDKNLEALSVPNGFKVDKTMINYLPKLKLLAVRATGFDNIDLAAAKKKQIMVTNTPGYGKEAVAEYVFALLLNLSRKIDVTLEEEGQTDAIDRRRERGFNLFGKTIGLIGLGATGQGVARIAQGFGMRVLACDPAFNSGTAAQFGVTLVDELDDLLRQADVVTLHLPLARRNTHLIDEAKLQLMKRHAILVNTARGELVDTVALTAALKNRQLGGAALDVVEDEYLLDPAEFLKFASQATDANRALALRHAVAVLALERLDNVIITNHNAYNTVEATKAIATMTAANLRGFFGGGKVYEVK